MGYIREREREVPPLPGLSCDYPLGFPRLPRLRKKLSSTGTLVSSSRTYLTHRYQDILYTFGSGHPAVHRGGPLGDEVEFAHQAAAVVHQDALVHTDQLHPFSD